MINLAVRLKECFDNYAYSYLSAWEHDPDMYVEDKTVMGRYPQQEEYETQMTEIFEALRDSVKFIPRATITSTNALRSRIGQGKFEALLTEAVRGIEPQSKISNATEFVALLNRRMISLAATASTDTSRATSSVQMSPMHHLR